MKRLLRVRMLAIFFKEVKLPLLDQPQLLHLDLPRPLKPPRKKNPRKLRKV
jgi:hypothetical protein